eukprot:CAMPEP_0204487484 /NCGR_PEP_ID=MMETSP0471-20130131/67058_1 /ASSEMBLY_ACC=CAM_ASM_000602 /TAXON_ID=2969 /ORGANISM="Oxyrrhis marina" /LENGTH=35 /DNA_ID= /DNA_START= /DNA_END= /DNA_ORIENTATION=
MAQNVGVWGLENLGAARKSADVTSRLISGKRCQHV